MRAVTQSPTVETVKREWLRRSVSRYSVSNTQAHEISRSGPAEPCVGRVVEGPRRTGELPMNEPSTQTAAALYARVSSDRQDVDLSVAAQLRALRDFAERNGYRVVREYVDEAESGRVADRPQFREMLDEASKTESPFQEILVWKFSRFTRKREHAVAFKSMLRRRGIRVTSITEHADDSPTGKLMEAIIESVDEFYSENLAQEVKRGMREAASRGFWVSPYVPYGYQRVHVQDGPKKRPRLELDPPKDAVARRIFDMALAGESVLEIAKGLNAEGIPSPRGKKWLKTTIHKMLINESYTGTLVWGLTDKSGAPPVRVEQAFPAIVSREEFERVGQSLQSRAPARVNPRQVASRYLLSGLVRCELCRKALTAAEAKGGKYSYYVCQSVLNGGSRSCETPRLNASRFERLIIEQIRAHILTESNIRELVKMVDEEMDGVAREERERLETIEAEREEVRRKMDRLWHIVESSDMEVNDILPRLRVHQERQAQLDQAADQARLALAERRELLDSADMVAKFAEEMGEFLQTSEVTEAKSFIHSFVKRIVVRPGRAVIHYTIPTPQDSPLGGGDVANVELSEGVRSTVPFGRA
ncbi:MAG: recombinase family protein [Chloroflexi bacterium]|nr:recombinase family protein [Chloroflexota bacterium]